MDHKEQIRNLMTSWDKSQAELADLLGIKSVSTIQSWLNDSEPTGPVLMWLTLLTEREEMRTWVERYRERFPPKESEAKRRRARVRKWREKQAKEEKETGE